MIDVKNCGAAGLVYSNTTMPLVITEPTKRNTRPPISAAVSVRTWLPK